MASVTATINVQINAANAAAQLTALQGKVAAMNKGMLAATAGGVMAQEKAIRRMGNVLSGSGMFTTGIRNVHTELGRMHQEFDRGSTTLQKYRQNSRVWGKDHSAINRMAADRVRMLQSQYVALGKEMNGVQQAMQIKPDRMMREFGADAEYAHQKAVLFRRNLQMGSTALVNWGKNTQWAGRQMMVGMGIPIAIMAAGAIRSFNDIEKSSIAFKRVYGDTTTSVAEKSQMLAKMQATVGKEMMKYGIAMSDTLDVSAKAAATGAQGADLIAATRETMRLATLGNMDYNKALEATIAMQTAFNINSKDMAKTTDFLNAVENQTILSMEDMALAVPRVAPVIKGLGGNVEDLAIMMTALRQGGVSAEQGANALKSGLGSLLNPTGTAIEQFDGLGINLKKIVDTNKGDLIGTIQGLGKALDGLTKYDRQRALESLFGKYQYSRMGALLKNINSKAVRETMKMAKASPGELAKMSEAELGQIADSPMIKLRKSIEELKAAAAPLGALFSDIGAKIISFATPVVEFFANNDVAKWGLVATAGFAALAGVVTMVVGVFANFAGSMVKAGMAVKTFFRFITGQRSLAYVTTDELQAAAAANSLATAADRAAGGMMAEAKAAQLLTSQLEALIAAQNGAAATSRRPGPGTTGVPAAPKPSGPIVPAPSATTASFTQAQRVAMLTREGTTVRSHVGQPIVFNKQQLAAIEKYHEAGVAKGQKSAIAFTEAARAGTLRGYSSIALGWGANTNMELSDSAKSLGVEKSRLLAQLQMRPGEVMAPFLDDLARNSGMTTEQVMSDPRVQSWANDTVNKLHSGIAQSAVQTFKDSDVERIAAPILSSIKDVSPEYAKGYARMLLPEEYGIQGEPRVSLQKGVVDKSPGQFAAFRPKTVKTGDAVALSNTHLANLRIGPGEEVTPNGLIVPKGTMDEQRQTANEVAKTQKQTPTTRTGNNMPGLFNSWDKKKPVPTPKQPVMQRRQFTGMGLMGVGMLAQTAMMGMEMAGKEVPKAAQFAATGLMGIGMAAMSFPRATERVGEQFTRIMTAMPPVIKAVAAIGLVVAGAVLLWKRFNEQTRQQGIDLGKSLNDTTSSINEVGTAFGKTSYVQQEIAKQQGTTTEQMTAAQQFLESDTGKKLLEQYTSESLKIGQNVAGTSLASKLASYVINSVMGTSDVKAFLGALKTENPAQGAQVERYVRGLMGGKMGKMPGTLANDIYGLQSDNTATTLALMQKQQQQIQDTSVIDTFKNADLKTKAITAITAISGMLNPTNIPGIIAGATLRRNMDVRGSMNRVGGLMASATNTQIQSGLQNRLALESQLNMLIEERNQLQKQSKDGALAAEDAKRLNYLNKAIPDTRRGIEQLGESLQQSSVAMDKMFEQSGNDDQKNAVLDSLNTMIQDTKDATAIFMADMAKNDPNLAIQDRFSIMSKLANGSLNPAGMQNMLAYGKQGMAGVVSSVNALPVDKLQAFSLEIGKMTGPQAQASLTNFGKRFVNAATAAKLSGREAKEAAKALGATPKQAKQVRVAVKMDKIKDLTKGVDKNVTVAANTDAAKKKIDDLRRAAEKATGKKIKINASDNAGAVIAKLRKLIKAADDADSSDPNVHTSTNADSTAGKIGALADVSSEVDGLGPINIDANDEATPVAQAAGDALSAVAGINPNPSISVTSNASSVASSAQQSMNSVQNVTRYIDIYERRHKASGGMFYASGGIHKGSGKVVGDGGPTDDKVNARLSNGEFVIRAKSVSKYGTAFLDAVNRGAYEKQAYANGTPMKGSLPPKESKAQSRSAQFNNEYKSMLWDLKNFNKEFERFGNVLGMAKMKGLFKRFQYDFSKYLVDTFSPKQIQKLYKSGDIKTVRKQFKAQQKFAALDEANSSFRTAKGTQGVYDLLKSTIRGGAGLNKINAIAGMSPEQYDSYTLMSKKNKSSYLGNLTRTQNLSTNIQELADRRQRIADTKKAYSKATGQDLRAVASARGLAPSDTAKYADALGMSMEELAQQVKDNSLPKNFEEIGKAAIKASEELAILGMTASERTDEIISNNQSRFDTTKTIAEANARKAIAGRQDLGGKSQNRLEAESALRDAQNAIDQARIDDINEKYSKQLEIFDQISQQQQAIANLERGRLSVANALSTGDIAAAAMAAQEQRSSTAAFMQDQMRNQLENQQKAQTIALQDQINERMRVNRDIQNAIALEIANANLNTTIGNQNILDLQDSLLTENDTLILQESYWMNINNQIAERNRLLSETTSVTPAAAAQYEEDTNKVVPKDLLDVDGKISRAKKKKKKKAFGGWVPGIGNRDNVPLLATPGEFVMRKAAAARFGPTLQAMNSGSIKEIGGSGGGVRIDNIIFNINGANLDERAVADIAVRKMKSLDSATIKGGRF